MKRTKWAFPEGHGCDVSRRCELLRYIDNHSEQIKTMMLQVSYNPDVTFRLRQADRGRSTLNDQLWHKQQAVCRELRRRGVESWSTVIPPENTTSAVVERTLGAQAPKEIHPCFADSVAITYSNPRLGIVRATLESVW